MFQMLPLTAPPITPDEDAVPTASEIPKEMDVFFRNEDYFLPEGKTWGELTEEELHLAKNRYRFSPMRPGIYQGITGFQGMI